MHASHPARRVIPRLGRPLCLSPRAMPSLHDPLVALTGERSKASLTVPYLPLLLIALTNLGIMEALGGAAFDSLKRTLYNPSSVPSSPHIPLDPRPSIPPVRSMWTPRFSLPPDSNLCTPPHLASAPPSISSSNTLFSCNGNELHSTLSQTGTDSASRRPISDTATAVHLKAFSLLSIGAVGLALTV